MWSCKSNQGHSRSQYPIKDLLMLYHPHATIIVLCYTVFKNAILHIQSANEVLFTCSKLMHKKHSYGGIAVFSVPPNTYSSLFISNMAVLHCNIPKG